MMQIGGAPPDCHTRRSSRTKVHLRPTGYETGLYHAIADIANAHLRRVVESEAFAATEAMLQADEWRDDLDLDGRAKRQAPLVLRWETKPHWPALKSEFGLDETGAAVVLSLFTEHLGANRPVSYSRRWQHYDVPRRYANRLYTYRKVIKAVDRLDALGFIDHDKAPPGRFGWQSAMRARPELVTATSAILQSGPRLRIAKPSSGVILRDADGMLVDYRDTVDTRRMEKGLEKFNEAIQATDISGCMAAPVVRIFNKTFGRGGRFYAVGGGWQSMKKEARQQITIAGEPVVEIDYRTLHPAILYAQAGFPLPEDAYTLGACAEWPRKLVKVALLILINAPNRHSARLAIAHSDAMELVAQPGSQEALEAAEGLIRTIKKAHQPIAWAFHTDKGAELMRLDSAMADSVMHMMLAQGVIVLPVHDSFLVPISKADQLEKAMLKAAHDAGIEAIRLEGMPS